MKLREVAKPTAKKPVFYVSNSVLAAADKELTGKRERAAMAQGRTEDLLKIAQEYKKNIKTILDKELYFFRNSDTHSTMKLDSKSGFLWVEQKARTHKRISQYSHNNVLMNWVDATWKDYPDRSTSYFATQSKKHAQGFGSDHEVMLVIPADNVRSFAYSEEDFNLSNSKHQTYANSVGSLYLEIKRLMAHQNELIDAFGSTESVLLPKIKEHFFQAKGVDIDKDIQEQDIIKVVEALDDLLDKSHLLKGQIKTMSDRRLFKVIDDFRSELHENKFRSIREMMDRIDPESHGDVELVHNLADIKKAHSSFDRDELWFTGSYLGLYWDSDGPTMLKHLYDRL